MSLGTNLKGFFTHLFAEVEPEAKQALEAFENKLTPAALTLMQDAIQTVAAETTGDVASREAAIARFLIDGKASGVAVATYANNALNALVKKKLPSSSTTQTPLPTSTATINGDGATA